MHKYLASLFLALLCCNQSFSTEKNLSHILEDMQLVGSADFHFLFWKIYQADLYSVSGSFTFFDDLPLALKLSYARSFSAENLLDETRKQLMTLGQEQGHIDSWVQRLGKIYVSVESGDALLLYIDHHGYSHFYFNSGYLGSIDDPEFSQQFSAIWLDREDRYAAFSQQLTGGGV